MKAIKFIVLVGGILGLLSFFLPLASVDRGTGHASVSAYQIVKGLDSIEVAVDQGAAQQAVDVETSASAKRDLGKLRGIVLAIYAPAALLALLGGLGVARKRFGRVAGAFALLSGLAGLGIAAVLQSAAGGYGGIGLSLLLLTGATGIIGGVLALAKPERVRKAVTVPNLATVTIARPAAAA